MFRTCSFLRIFEKKKIFCKKKFAFIKDISYLLSMTRKLRKFTSTKSKIIRNFTSHQSHIYYVHTYYIHTDIREPNLCACVEMRETNKLFGLNLFQKNVSKRGKYPHECELCAYGCVNICVLFFVGV